MTNGLVSIVDGDKVLLKAVCGCDGYNANKVVESFHHSDAMPNAAELYRKCLDVGFGCQECLVVQSHDGEHCGMIFEDAPTGRRYAICFNNAALNPRWEHPKYQSGETLAIIHSVAFKQPQSSVTE